ncbi:MAG: hypothetical protein QNJ38_22845 [Prochloraceae cyanobacterium]|nr:hypothetical protein [Prochloraceae cyanobacterium]
MSELLDRAIAKVKQLPKSQQDEIAATILEELEDEARWDSAFSKSPDLLAKLAAKALAEDEAGKTKELDLDSL